MPEVKAQRIEAPRAQPCWQTPCHSLPTNLHLVSLHSFVSPPALSHCSLLECGSSSFFSPNNLLVILQNLVQMTLWHLPKVKGLETFQVSSVTMGCTAVLWSPGLLWAVSQCHSLTILLLSRDILTLGRFVNRSYLGNGSLGIQESSAAELTPSSTHL